MGLLGKIFGSKVAKKPSGELLKEATQLKKNLAIGTVRSRL